MIDLGIINDMEKGWVRGKDRPLWHRKVYDMWRCEWSRIYGDIHYFGCLIHPDFKYLSNFVAWIKSEPRYDEFKANPHGWCIDKDMKSPGNKLYYPEYMTLTTRSENTREQVLRCGNSHLLYAKRTYHTKPVIGINNNSVVLLKSISHGKLKGFTPNGICAG